MPEKESFAFATIALFKIRVAIAACPDSGLVSMETLCSDWNPCWQREDSPCKFQ